LEIVVVFSQPQLRLPRVPGRRVADERDNVTEA